MNAYLKTKLEAERQRLDELTDQNGWPLGLAGGPMERLEPVLQVEGVRARIAMLKEIIVDLEEARIVMAKLGETRPAFKWPSEFLTPDE